MGRRGRAQHLARIRRDDLIYLRQSPRHPVAVLKLSLGPSLDPRLPLAALILLSHPLSILFFGGGEQLSSVGA